LPAIPFLGSDAVFLAASCLDKIHLAGVFFDPVVSLVFLICEDRGGSVFSDTGGDGQTARSGADDDHVVDFAWMMHCSNVFVAETRMLS
jgi:hypothetical protein